MNLKRNVRISVLILKDIHFSLLDYYFSIRFQVWNYQLIAQYLKIPAITWFTQPILKSTDIKMWSSPGSGG